MSEPSHSPIDNLITEHIDIWSSAIKRKSSSGRGSSKKIELYGIKKLRELILELAVRGKLVAQDPNDEPASVLLARISQEKAELVKQGKIKKPKKLPEISEEEKLFELPKGWGFSRLSCLLDRISNGFSGKQNKDFNGYPLSRIETISGSFVDFEKVGFSPNIPNEKLEYYKLEKGDILLSHINSDYHVGKTAIYDGSKVLYHGVNLLLVRVNCNFSSSYLDLVLNQLRLSGYFLSVAQHAIGQSSINQTIVQSLITPVPPLVEQHRIVAKVDELMALCDQLEVQTESSLDAHQTLVTTLLDTLVNSQNSDELAENWTRISGHFDTLFTTEQSIDQLKQTILQLAVMGKLVPQDPNDEPASVLLERITAEKDVLIKQKKIKKQKPLPPISDDEKPFELPKGWECERVGTFCLVGTGATPSRSNSAYWSSAQYNWVSSGETSKLYISDTNEKISELAVKETNVTVYPTGTLIVAMYGQGKTRGQVSELLHPAGTNQACAAIQLVEKDIFHKDYVKLFFLKSYNELREFAAGGAQPNLNVAKVANTIVPIPPLPEQHRIVAKVDQLMDICDQLKARLSEAQTTQLNLADALVAQAVD